MSGTAARILDVLFGCSHKFGFPLTRRRGRVTYQVCVRCGAEFEYDWATMSRKGRLGQDSQVADLNAERFSASRTVA